MLRSINRRRKKRNDAWEYQEPQTVTDIEEAIEYFDDCLETTESEIEELETKQCEIGNKLDKLREKLEAAKIAEASAELDGIGSAVRVSVCGTLRNGTIVRVEPDEGLFTVAVDGTNYVYRKSELGGGL